MSYQPPSPNQAFEDPQNAQRQQQPKDSRTRLQKIKDLDTKTVVSYLRYANLCNAICIITAGIITGKRKSIIKPIIFSFVCLTFYWKMQK
jgi:hypothetical protein